MTVGGGEPKATLSLAQAQEAPEAVPPDEPPSPPLTPADRQSVQVDLDLQRDLLARHQNTEPLLALYLVWKQRSLLYELEIARLERMLEDR